MNNQNGSNNNFPNALLKEALTGGLVALATASIAYTSNIATSLIGACTDDVRILVEHGYVAMLTGDVETADGFATDAVLMAPRCGCAMELAAEVSYLQSLKLTGKKRKAALEAKREECFEGAINAAKFGVFTERTKALKAVCSSSGPYGR